MTKEDKFFLNHFTDLSKKADRMGIPVFTDFCGMNELNILKSNASLYPTEFLTFGGYKDAFRIMAAFLPEYYEKEDVEFPIDIIKISSRSGKFSDKLTHRDYLGSLMGLGIERDKIGDIVLTKEPFAYLMACRSISDYICENLIAVKHTDVTCTVDNSCTFDIHPEFKEVTIQVASMRLDCILAGTYNLSRSSSAQIISGKNVFINGRLTDSPSDIVKNEDVISVRGKGKFIISDLGRTSKKGKQIINSKIFK